MSEKPKFYATNWFMWLTLILFTPVGLFCMWKYKRFNDQTRKILTVVFSLYFIGMVAYVNSPGYKQEQQAKQQAEQKKIADEQAAQKATADAELKKLDAEQKKIEDQQKAEEAKMNSDIMYFTQVKAKEVFKDRFVKAEKLDDGGILITFKLEGTNGFGGLSDSSKMFAVYKGRTKDDYKDVTMVGTCLVQDKNGNRSYSGGWFAITLDKDTIQKTTFENLSPTDLIPLSSSHAIRPELLGQ